MRERGKRVDNGLRLKQAAGGDGQRAFMDVCAMDVLDNGISAGNFDQLGRRTARTRTE